MMSANFCPVTIFNCRVSVSSTHIVLRSEATSVRGQITSQIYYRLISPSKPTPKPRTDNTTSIGSWFGNQPSHGTVRGVPRGCKPPIGCHARAVTPPPSAAEELNLCWQCLSGKKESGPLSSEIP